MGFSFLIRKRKMMFPDRRGDKEKMRRVEKEKHLVRRYYANTFIFNKAGKKSEFLTVNSSIIYMY